MRKAIRRSAVLMFLFLPLAGCLDWIDVDDHVRPEDGSPRTTTPPPPVSVALCGVENFAAVIELACARERGLCQRWAQCPEVSTPTEECVVERESECQKRVRFGLESGACFRTDIHGANVERGCYGAFLDVLGMCVLPTLEELTVLSDVCEDDWTPGAIPQGGACFQGAPGCAAAESPDRYHSCLFDPSFEVGGGVCGSVANAPRGAACDAAAGGYCNNSDGCLSSGVCAPRHALGESCAVDNDCASRLCAAGVCTDPEGFSCVERSCPQLWSCEDQRCTRITRR
jgi:hypothetical protein